MAQHDYNLANASGATIRADMNNALLAVVSLNSGAAEPSTMFAGMLWHDTSTATLKRRNAANGAWVTIGPIDSPLLAATEAASGIVENATQAETNAGTDDVRFVSPTKLLVRIATIIQNIQSAPYTLVIGDAGGHVLHPTSDASARTFTIPANASVAFPIGTTVAFVNQNGAGVLTIAIASDTMRLAGVGTTGSRSLAANGVATALKITSIEWIISGVGLT